MPYMLASNKQYPVLKLEYGNWLLKIYDLEKSDISECHIDDSTYLRRLCTLVVICIGGVW